MTLTWTRSKKPHTYDLGGGPRTEHFTTYAATLSNGDAVEIKSVEGSFFFYLNGEQTRAWADTLKEAKATWQRVEDRLSK